MEVSRDQLLQMLPPFNNRSVVIEPSQDVPDIIREVVNAHEYFAADYDYIFQLFDSDRIGTICRNLYSFCKHNIQYIVEGEEEQTTKSPAAILAMGYGDCKHYAGFIAGVLSAITRNTGKRIDWKYRFASYELFDNQPGHVFIIVNDRGNEFWVDPVLESFNSRSMQPVFIVDKKINTMLSRVAGMPENFPGEFERDFYNAIGFIDPLTIATGVKVVSDFVKTFGGGDQVPNYPIKTQATLDNLIAQIAVEIPLPPKSVEQANQLLQKTLQSRAQHVATGGSGAANQTVIMMYDEIIAALQNYIAQGGGPFGVTPGLPGVTQPGQYQYPTEYNNEFGNPVIWAAGAGLLVWLFTKKPLYALGGAAAGYFVRDRMNKQ